MAAVLVVVVLMGSGAVYAAKNFFDIEYFWGRYGSKEMSKEARKLVDDNPMVTVKQEKESGDIVDFKVSSVLCDSKYVVVTLDVDVKDADRYFLITDGTDLTDPVSCLSLGIDSKQSIAEYCSANGLQVVQINTGLDQASKKLVDIVTRDNQQASTGNGSIMICAERLTRDKDFMMGITTSVRISEEGKKIAGYKGDTLQVDVKDRSTGQTAYYRVDQQSKYHVPGTEITIQEVKLTTTEVGTYSEITYVDKSTSEDPAVGWLFLCDEDGGILQSNIVAIGTCRPEGNNVYVAKDCYESIGLPDEVYVSIGDLDKVVKLKKVE